jgi:proline-specific peptidase
MKSQEGKITIDGYQVWYKIVGDSDCIPLLTLHGGPGAGHDYLESLEALSSTRPVIFFDQLGCGKSDKPDDTSLWRIERFVKEVDTVRQALGLDRVNLLGQSWGGWLSIEYMLSKPKGIVSLTLASTSASIPQFVEETKRLKAELPPQVYQTMLECEAAEDYHHPDYEAAVTEFYNRHLCRLEPWPEPLQRSGKNLENNAVYETMNGPNEFIVIGNLKDWNRIDRLGEITVPTLITVGRYDEITPTCAETMRRGIPNSQLHIFEKSAHTAHLEESEKYMAVLTDFLARVESKS